MTLTISSQAARRYILGRQGLWPGRRWQGAAGTEQAMRAMEHLQLDPLNIVARAHDLMLQGRVLGYRPDDWRRPVYENRRFFEWGGWLAVRPIEELPHWRVLMGRELAIPRRHALALEHAAAIEEMRGVLAERETVANRDFAMAERTRVDSYRGRKDSAVALHHLWLVGEAMVTRRDRFERVYARPELVAPAVLLQPSDGAAADHFHLLKHVAFEGLTRFSSLTGNLRRPAPPAEIRAWRDAQVAAGTLVEVQVAGWRGSRWALAQDRDVIAELDEGGIPAAWTPLGATTDEEATFLSPLEPVSARGRSREIFGFDYTWEVYTPAVKRRFGYYTLPILWRDGLVGRFDSRFERALGTFVLLGLWLEDDAFIADPDFVAALRSGLARFLGFLGATRLDATALPPRLRRAIGKIAPLV